MWNKRHDTSARAFHRRLLVEQLEDRRLLATNLKLVDAYLVDGLIDEIASPVLGEQVGVYAVFEYEDLPSDADYRVDYTIDGVTLSRTDLRVGAGDSSGTYSWYRTGWLAGPGEHTVVVKVDGGDTVAESDETDNTLTFQFTPTPGSPPAKYIWPVEGAPFTETYISNYVDVDPIDDEASDYTGSNAVYDGHTAWDIGVGNFNEMDLGVQLYAAAAGTVSAVHEGEYDRHTTWGSPTPTANYVKIDHGDGWQTIYWHMRRDSLQVEVGQAVEEGDFIGYMGSSGKSSGAHLHFGVRHHGRTVEPGYDPETYFHEPLRYVGDAATVYRSGVTNYSPSSHTQERPSDVEVFKQISGQKTYVWARFAGLRQSDLMEFVWIKPNGNTYVTRTHNVTADDSNYLKLFSQTLPTLPDIGTWKVEFKINGSKLGEDTFVVTTDGAPEIRVEEDGEIILDERYTPVDFGTVSLNAASPAKTFTVTNHGDDALTLTTPVVPAGFSVNEALATSLAPGASDTFTVSLATETAGYYAGQVRFSTNDVDELAYNFSIEGIVDSLSTDVLILGISERHAREGDSLFANVRRLGDTTNPLTVTLTSLDSTEISVPATVTIPAGEERAGFLVQAVQDSDFDGDQVAGILANATGYATAQNRLEIINEESLVISMSATSISESGGMATGTVTRGNTNLEQSLTVNLASSDTTEVTVPTTVTIAAGQSSGSFAVTAQDDALLDGPKMVTITASANDYASATAGLEVADHEVLTVALALESIAEKVLTSATVSRSNSDITQPLVVSLASTDTSEATVPASVTIPADAASVDFLVTAIDDGLDDGTQSVQVSADAAGYISLPADLDVVSHPFPWQNFVNSMDVDGDGVVILLDALVAINDINLNGARLLPDPDGQFSPPPYYDVNGNGYLTAIDVLVIFNHLIEQAAAEAEAEGEAAMFRMPRPAVTSRVTNKRSPPRTHQAVSGSDAGAVASLLEYPRLQPSSKAADAVLSSSEDDLTSEQEESLEALLDSLFPQPLPGD